MTEEIKSKIFELVGQWKSVGREAGQYAIATLVFYGLGYTMQKLFVTEIPSSNRDAFMMILGFLVAKGGTVVDWFFGSSKGSADKTEALAEK